MSKRNSDITHYGHRKRLIENFMSEQNSPLTNVQYVEMLLFYCIPRVDTNPIAHRLLNRFGSIDGIMDASESELASVEGIGKISAKKLKRIAELSLKYKEASQKRRNGSSLTRKIITDTIMLGIREARYFDKERPSCMLLHFKESGKLAGKYYLRHSIPEMLRSLNASNTDDTTVSVFCIPEVRLQTASKEEDKDKDKDKDNDNGKDKDDDDLCVFSDEYLKSLGVDVVAYISANMMINYKVL